jgi:hypothetical protein
MENQTFYSKLEDCYDNTEEGKTAFFVARDHLYKDGGSKQYTFFNSSVQYQNFLTSVPKQQRNFYEIIPADVPRYEYYDIDGWDYTKFPTPRSFFNYFINARNASNLSEKIFLLSQVVVLEACAYDDNDLLTKGSLHIINKGLTFQNQQSMKLYMKEISVFFSENYPELKIDLAVYSKNQCFRMEGNTKKGKQRYFSKPSWCVSLDHFDSFITVDVNSSLLWEGSEERLRQLEIQKEERIKRLELIKTDLQDENLFNDVISRLQDGTHPKIDVSSGKLTYDNWRYLCISIIASYGINLLEKNFDVIYNLYRHAGNDSEMIRQLNSWRTFNVNPDNKQFFLSFGNLCKNDNIVPFPIKKKYNDKWCQPIIPVKKCYILKAYMGKGKTTQISKYLNQNTDKSVIFLTSRRTFASSLFNRLKMDCPDRDWMLYLNRKVDDIVKSRNLIIQVESLHKIQQHFDIVVIDECESILYQMTSLTTHKANIYDNMAELKNIISKSKNVILADAFVSKKTIHFVNSLGLTLDTEYHIYKTLPENRTAIPLSTKPDFINSLISTLSLGKNVFLFSTSIKKLENYIIPSISKALPNIKINTYSSSNIKKLDNINEEWSSYNLIATTSSITIGCNFDVKDYFDCIYVYASASSKNLVRDIFQAHMRVRHIKDNKLFFYLDPRPIGIKSDLGISQDVIVQDIEYKELFFKEIYNTSYIEIEDVFKNLYINNRIEHNLSMLCLEKVFYEYLERCGYKLAALEALETYDCKDDEKKIVQNDVEYDKISEITKSELYALNLKRKTIGLNDIEKLMIEKYYFQITILDIHPEKERLLWDLYCDYGKSRFKNMSLEKSHHSTIELLERDGQVCFWSDTYILRLEIIKNICKLLGLKNTGELRTISRSVLESRVQELKMMKEKIKHIFDLRDRSKSEVFGLKEATSLINEVLSRWGYTSLKVSSKRQRETVNGKRVSISPYETVSNNDINVFDYIKPYTFRKSTDDEEEKDTEERKRLL